MSEILTWGELVSGCAVRSMAYYVEVGSRPGDDPDERDTAALQCEGGLLRLA